MNIETFREQTLHAVFTGSSITKAFDHGTSSPFLITPHPKAPLFSDREKGQQIIRELITAVTSSNFQEYPDVREYIRQVGLVSLWFFLKFIAGYNGPYNEINQDLHLDMCNFRQSHYWLEDGARASVFIPRGHFKSTLFTHGPNTWELSRNPNMRIRLVNAIISMAKDFARLSQRTIDSNEFYKWLYPEHVPTKVPSRDWNEDRMVMPSRTRFFKEPSLKAGGIEASAEGDHHDYLCVDDPVGLDELDSDHAAAARMESAKKWFRTNTRALLDNWHTSRIGFIGTRYAVNDVGELMLQDAKKIVGYQHPDYETNKDNVWTVYYRLAIEQGEPIFPNRFPLPDLERLMKEDYWTFITQYMNDPKKAGLSEFGEYEPRWFTIEYSSSEQDYIITKENTDDVEMTLSDYATAAYDQYDYSDRKLRLSDCSVVMAVDPAGTDAGETLSNCRTSIGIWAMDSSENVYRIWSKVGMFSPEKMFDFIFLGNKTFQGYLKTTYFESNAMQKSLRKLLEREKLRRNDYLSVTASIAKGNKFARIRNFVGLKLSQNKLYVSKETAKEFLEEQRLFPQSKNRVDVLDESATAIANLYKPVPVDQKMMKELFMFEKEQQMIDNPVGY